MSQIKVLGKGLKSIAYVLSCHGWGLTEVVELFLVHTLNSLRLRYLAFFNQINSVSRKVDQNVVICVILNLWYPGLHWFERLFSLLSIIKNDDLLCCIIDYYCSLAVFVKKLSYRSKLLLACSIPDLKLYKFAFYLHDKSTKFDSDSNLMVTLEHILC